ncbi:MAG: hypothetical protein V1886_04410 [archaeon]
MVKQDRQFWKDYGYVIRGKQRRIVIKEMSKPMSVTEIKKKASLSLSETSRVLRQFAKQGLAVCITPEHVQGRIYQLSKRGEAVNKALLSQEKEE